ncbi:MAG: hypothetical protein GWO24_31190 [Akkermansiaceae bacterium]|nr:hypothetical protein [Akkermansiaceae bacterium]
MKRRLGQQPIEADVGLLRVLLGKCGLAQPSGWLPFTTKDYLPSNHSTSPANLFSGTIPRTMTIRSWFQGVYVATTNDGSNYWTIALVENDLTSIASLDTSGMSAGAWSVLSEAGIDTEVGASDVALMVRVTKTGSPGNLYLHGPAVFVT